MVHSPLFLILLAAGAPGPFDGSAPFEAGLGVNIHFTRASAAELDLLERGGFRWVRMDFAWGAVEREDGKYRFDDYDFLVAEMEKRKIRCLFILDYGHPRITGGLPPSDSSGRAAYARFAGAAAAHFRGRRVVWEIWNEPNIAQFWRPKPDVKAYIAMAREAIAAIKKGAPDAMVIAPATSTIDFPFLEACLAAGLLEGLDAVSVHPYRGGAPETAEAEIRRLQNLTERYRPAGREIPIVSGEWGYSTAGMSPERQAEYIVRQQVMDRALGLPFSIWYDWKDDGPDPRENEHRFGTVAQDLSPKPAYEAIRAAADALRGAVPAGRIDLGDPRAFVVLFRGPSPRGSPLFAAWSDEGKRTVKLPLEVKTAAIRRGSSTEKMATKDGVLEVELSTAPLVIGLPGDLQSPWLTLAERLLGLAGVPVRLRAGSAVDFRKRFENPLPVAVRGEFSLELPEGIEGRMEPREFTLGPGRGFGTTLHLELKRWIDGEPRAVLVLSGLDPALGRAIRVPFPILADPGLVLEPAPLDPESPAVTLAPTGRSFESAGAVLTVSGASPAPVEVEVPGRIDGPLPLKLPLPPAPSLPADGVSAKLSWGSFTFQRTYRPVPLDPAGLKVRPDGDGAVAGEAKVEAAGRGIRIRYSVGKGWKFFAAAPAAPLPLKEVPAWIALRARGKGDHVLRVRFADSTGQTFQATLGTPGEDWTTLSAGVEARGLGHWGGANDGAFHPPLRWEAVLLVDSASREAHEGEVEVRDLVMIEDR